MCKECGVEKELVSENFALIRKYFSRTCRTCFNAGLTERRRNDGKKKCEVCGEVIPLRNGNRYCGKICHDEIRRLRRNQCEWIDKLEHNVSNNGIAVNSEPTLHSKSKKVRGINRKKELLALLGGRCKTCGYIGELPSMCFHHLRDKLFTLDQRNLYQKPMDVILLELAKCELMCYNCHAEHHETERIKKRHSGGRVRLVTGRQNKKKLIDKSGGCCEKCGYTTSFTQSLTFHHIDASTKLFELNIVKLDSFPDPNDPLMISEWEKCQLLCANCHISMNVTETRC